jgi:hypothetical protein
MKSTLLAVLLTLYSSLSLATESQKCEDCPEDKPCPRALDDGCNVCTISTYCKDGKWYSLMIAQCTLRACLNPVEIDPPKEKE